MFKPQFWRTFWVFRPHLMTKQVPLKSIRTTLSLPHPYSNLRGRSRKDQAKLTAECSKTLLWWRSRNTATFVETCCPTRPSLRSMWSAVNARWKTAVCCSQPGSCATCRLTTTRTTCTSARVTRFPWTQSDKPSLCRAQTKSSSFRRSFSVTCRCSWTTCLKTQRFTSLERFLVWKSARKWSYTPTASFWWWTEFWSCWYMCSNTE